MGGGCRGLGLHYEHGVWASKGNAASAARLGLEIVHAETARGKRIEGAFNEVQAHMAGGLVRLANGDARRLYDINFMRVAEQDLGRLRGEHERAKQLWMQMRAGTVDPRAAGVMHLSQMMDFVAAEIESFNRRPFGKRTQLAGHSPEEVWLEGIAAAPLRRLTEYEDAGIAAGITLRAVRGGWVMAESTRFEDAYVLYSNPMLLAAIGGNRVNVELRWDAAESTRAAVFARENRLCGQVVREAVAAVSPDFVRVNNFTPGQLQSLVQPGDFLGWVERMDKAPKYDFSGLKGRGHFVQSKAMRQYLKQARLSYVALFGRCRRGGLADERHDGRGNSTAIQGAHFGPRAAGEIGERVEAIAHDAAATREARLAEEAAMDAAPAPAPLPSRAAPAAPPRGCRRCRGCAPLAANWQLESRL